MSEPFWRVTAVLIVAGLFYIGAGLRIDSPSSGTLGGRAYAGGVGIGTNETELVLTASDDGRTVYVWRYIGVRPPMYLGKAEISGRDQ